MRDTMQLRKNMKICQKEYSNDRQYLGSIAMVPRQVDLRHRGGSGINYGIAAAFASLGANVAICSRSQERLDAAATELARWGGKILPVAADVRHMSEMETAIDKALQAHGPADVVIAGAAGNFLCAAENLSSNEFKTVIDIDLVGSFIRRGVHSNNSSKPKARSCSSRPDSPSCPQVHVGAAKAGIDNMMRNLALEGGRFGIRSNSIAPGFIGETEGTRRMSASGSVAQIVGSTPLGRLGTVEDIGNMAVFLSSPLASFVTGTSVIVDGGHYLNGLSVLNNFQSVPEQTLLTLDAGGRAPPAITVPDNFDDQHTREKR